MATESLPRYTLLEDIQGLTISMIGASLGMFLLGTAGLITGGTAGIALLLSYATSWSFGLTFFVVNLPFYIFAYMRRGLVFTVKSFLAVALVSLFSTLMPTWMTLSYLDPAMAAVLFGVICGVALLGLYRHGSSLGGVSILALLIQDATGIRAGWFQLGWDVVVFAVALMILPFNLVCWSLFGAVILNFVIAMNHRRDWYLAS